MTKLSGDVKMLTAQLNSAKLVNKDMLNEVEKEVRSEITTQIDVGTGNIGNYPNKCRFKLKLQILLQKPWQHRWNRLLH